MGFRALYRKEMQAYFGAPLFYVVAAVFLGLSGFFFYTNLIFFVQYGFGYDILGNFWMTLLAGAPYSLSTVLLLTVPLLTMRLFAEEWKLGTMELLLTYPLRDAEVYWAKFAACATVLLVILAATLLYPICVYALQPFALAPVLAGYAGLTLLGLSFVACGLFVSALTDNQVVAATGSLGFLLLAWMVAWNEAATRPPLLQLAARLSMFDHFEAFARGVIDAADVAYFLAFISFFSFLTLRVLESRHWRGRR